MPTMPLLVTMNGVEVPEESVVEPIANMGLLVEYTGTPMPRIAHGVEEPMPTDCPTFVYIAFWPVVVAHSSVLLPPELHAAAETAPLVPTWRH